MKNLLIVFVAFFSLSMTAFGQGTKISDMPTYSGNPSGAWVPVVVNGMNRKLDAGLLGYNKMDTIFLRNDTVFGQKGGSSFYFKFPKTSLYSGHFYIDEDGKVRIIDSLLNASSQTNIINNIVQGPGVTRDSLLTYGGGSGEFVQSPRGTWTSASNLRIVFAESIDVGQDEKIQFDYSGTDNRNIGISLSEDFNLSHYDAPGNFSLAVNSSGNYIYTKGNYEVGQYGVGVAVAPGDHGFVKRSSGVISAGYIRGGVEVILFTFSGTYTGKLYRKMSTYLIGSVALNPSRGTVANTAVLSNYQSKYLTEGKFLIGDANGEAAEHPLSGDVTVTSTGVATVNRDTIAAYARPTVGNGLKYDAGVLRWTDTLNGTSLTELGTFRITRGNATLSLAPSMGEPENVTLASAPTYLKLHSDDASIINGQTAFFLNGGNGRISLKADTLALLNDVSGYGTPYSPTTSDTTAFKPLGINRSTGALAQVNAWPAGGADTTALSTRVTNNTNTTNTAVKTNQDSITAHNTRILTNTNNINTNTAAILTKASQSALQDSTAANTLDGVLRRNNESSRQIKIKGNLVALNAAFYAEDTTQNESGTRNIVYYQSPLAKTGDTYRPNFSVRSNISVSQNGVHNANHLFTLGVNQPLSGAGYGGFGVEDTSRGAIDLGIESYYEPTGTVAGAVQEFHIIHRSKYLYGKTNRWFSFLGSETGDEQSMLLQLSSLSLNDHNHNSFITFNPVTKSTTFVSGSSITLQGNNQNAFVQNNAAGTGTISLPYVNASDRIVIGSLQVATASASILNPIGGIELGTSSVPITNPVTINGSAANGVLLALGNTLGVDIWEIRKAATNLAFYNSSGGTTPFYISKSATTNMLAIESDRVQSTSKIIAPYFSNVTTTVRELTLQAANASDLMGAFLQNTASNATSNFASVILAPHSGFSQSDAPRLEAYNVSNNAGIRLKSYNSGTLINAMDIAPSGAATFNNNVLASYFVVGGTTVREFTAKASNVNDAVGMYIQNTAANTGTNTATVYLAAHSGFGTSTSPRIESYNSSNNAGVRIKSYNGSLVTALDLTTSGAAVFYSSITTGTPASGTAAAWKLGSYITGATVSLSTTKYVQVDIGGTAYKLAIVE